MNNLGLEYFSSGHNATVYRLLDPSQLPGRAQDAQLVRKEQSRDQLAYAKVYAAHRLCYLLFPDNFIDVKACAVLQTGPEPMRYSHGE